jgi:hypothetical protein
MLLLLDPLATTNTNGPFGSYNSSSFRYGASLKNSSVPTSNQTYTHGTFTIDVSYSHSKSPIIVAAVLGTVTTLCIVLRLYSRAVQITAFGVADVLLVMAYVCTSRSNCPESMLTKLSRSS